MVAELKIVLVPPPSYDAPLAQKEAELMLLRRGRWSVERPAVVVHRDSPGAGDEDDCPLLSS